MITCRCYGKEHKFKTQKEGVMFFLQCCCSCDPNSSEAGRYMHILRQIDAGLTFCTDEDY